MTGDGALRIATWNVNSVRKRMGRLVPWLESRSPDVVCLQETKVEDDLFPEEALREAGYHAAILGQKTYNGVAVLSRHPLEVVSRNLGDGGDDTQARLLDVRTGGLRLIDVYIPNGKEVEDPAFVYKLEWMARLARYLEVRCDPGEPLILCGDFNVAPEPIDLHDPVGGDGKVLFHPDEREAFARFLRWGMVDTVRHHHPDTPVFSFWDYRRLAFPRNEGYRIDHILVTRPLLPRCREAFVDREARKGKEPSDHAPVVAVLDPL